MVAASSLLGGNTGGSKRVPSSLERGVQGRLPRGGDA